MKILLCTDGSEYSQKALEQTALIAGGCNVDEVAIIYVYDHRHDTYLPFESEGSFSPAQIESYKKIIDEDKEERKKILSETLKFLQEKKINASTIFKEGHPSHTIVKVAQEGGFDMIVIGSEGLSGLKKFLLGSISNAVIQEVKNCSVLVVK